MLLDSVKMRRWPFVRRLAGAAFLVFIALGLQTQVWSGLRDYPFLLFFPTIVFATVLFGFWPGLISVGLSALGVATALFPPVGSPFVESPQQAMALVLFVIIGLISVSVIGLLNGALSDLAQKTDDLAKAEAHKDLLLREAAHRFRNDLATLAALLRLQERSVSSAEAKEALRATADRIGVMTGVQDRLQREAGTKAIVWTDDFIVGLCDDMKAALIGLRPIRLDVKVERQPLSQEHAVAVGLIINEQISNALKYAFPDNRYGEVRVTFERKRRFSPTYRLAA